MKLLIVPVIAALASLCTSAKKSTQGTFEEFHRKSVSSTPVKLDDATYESLTSAPRDYHVAVLLTALEARFGCQLCRDFQPEWDVLGKSWLRGDKKGISRLIFGTLDFQDGKAAFQRVRRRVCFRGLSVELMIVQLMLQTAPVLLLFPPTTGPHARPDPQAVRYDFTTG